MKVGANHHRGKTIGQIKTPLGRRRDLLSGNGWK